MRTQAVRPGGTVNGGEGMASSTLAFKMTFRLSGAHTFAGPEQAEAVAASTATAASRRRCLRFGAGTTPPWFQKP